MSDFGVFQLIWMILFLLVTVVIIFLSLNFANIVANKIMGLFFSKTQGNNSKVLNIFLQVVLFCALSSLFIISFIFSLTIGGVPSPFGTVPLILYFLILIFTGLFLIPKAFPKEKWYGIITAIILILFVSFMFLAAGGNTPPLIPNTITTIGNALSANNYTRQEVSKFLMSPGETVRSSHFSDKGIDECSFYFDKGRFSDKQIGIEFDDNLTDGCDFAMSNITSSPINAQATVICEADSTDLEQAIDDANLTSIISHAPSEVWGNGFDISGFDKVCVVVLKRSS
ncbi:MAG: hypothetical protein WC915_02190 [archaeon]|jgi:hypothetical protein